MGCFCGCPYILACLDNDDDILAKTINLADAGSIDPLENMLEDKIFIYQGIVDTIVPWSMYDIFGLMFIFLSIAQAGRIHAFYSQLTAEENILEKSDLDSEHGFVRSIIFPSYLHLITHFQPSDSFGGDCELQNPPFYINDCNYNGAENVIVHFYPLLKKKMLSWFSLSCWLSVCYNGGETDEGDC